jgi:hypothetical protein
MIAADFRGTFLVETNDSIVMSRDFLFECFMLLYLSLQREPYISFESLGHRRTLT